jgi:hypothetical protein
MTTSRKLVRKLIAQLPAVKNQDVRRNGQPHSTRPEDDLPKWLDDHGFKYKVKSNVSGNRTGYLITCPFDSSHAGTECIIMQDNDTGQISFKCQHDSCKDKSWKDAREKIAPGESQPRAPYLIEHGCIAQESASRDGKRFTIPLCNFTANIVEQTILDDGVERRLTLALEGKLADQTPLPRTLIPAAEFAAMGWIVPSWGPRAVVHAGMGTKDHLRAAVQLLSGDVPSKLIYGHTGWREIGGQWAYLHSGGAIGARGTIVGIEVALPDSLALYAVPEPVQGHELRECIRATLQFLQVAPERVTIPLLASAYRAVLLTADFAVHISGRTGTLKTALATVNQQRFGAGMDVRHLPGSWSSTGNSLEALAFVAKDALLVIDDFNPHGSVHDVARAHREADRVIRAQGNLSGRGRCRPDGSPRPTKPPRGLILSTGEDIPRGQSLRARLLTLELSPGEVDLGKLTQCQADAAAGKYAMAMAGYLQWLAPKIEGIRQRLPGKVAGLRSEHATEGQHGRTPGIAADLFIGIDYFLRFAEECRAISHEERKDYLGRTKAALATAVAEQVENLEAAEPTSHFLRLIAAALTSGRAHVASSHGNRPRNAAAAWGWHKVGAGDWAPQGKRIGWLHGEDLYLSPDAAFAEAQKLAAEQGETLPIAEKTLWKRCRERGLLVSFESGRCTIRHTIDGMRRYCVHFRAKSVYGRAELSQSSQIMRETQKRPRK